MHTAKILLLGLIAVGLSCVGGCVTTDSPPPRYTPSFDYSPQSQSPPASAGVTFAVVSPRFPQSARLFRLFADNMASDFQEVLTALGFTTRGPFRSYDEMTYPDKEGSDLLLIPEVDFEPDLSQVRWSAPPPGLSILLTASTGNNNSLQKASGEMIITGHLNLVVSESLTGERMWTKSVSTVPITVPVDTRAYYDPADTTFLTLVENEATIYNSLARALEKFYTEVLHKSYTYLDPREMVLVSKKAREVRERKVYQ